MRGMIAPDHPVLAAARQRGWPSARDGLLAAVLEELKAGARGTTTLDDALAYLDMDELGQAADAAVAALRTTTEEDGSAASDVIHHTALQAPQLLAERLPELWELAPNRRSYSAMWPWRTAPAGERERLAGLVRDEDDRAARALCETRRPATVEAIDPPPSADLLAEVGFVRGPDGLSRLASDACFHVVWPSGVLDARIAEAPPHLRPHHPTWAPPAGDPPARARAYGAAKRRCGACDGQLCRLLEWDAPPPGLGLAGHLELATCLSCLGWEPAHGVMCFAHDDDGFAEPLPAPAPADPIEPFALLTEHEVTLAPAPARWVMQDWGTSNSCENLNRVGGEPTWIQNAAYPPCPGCDRTMRALAQLDSDPPSDEGWLWGSGGIAYVSWCDGCRISAVQWQCT
jgi:hypothetical protein